MSHRLMASTISDRGEPVRMRVNLVARALEPDYLLLDIFLHLRDLTSLLSQNINQCQC